LSGDTIKEYNSCWGYTYNMKSIRIVGNPGRYQLFSQLTTFGKYIRFNNNTVKINVHIKECNSNYIHQDKDNINIKSCYLPQCNPPCNPGICINEHQ